VKLRHGFVSNSSSSSYVAVIVRPPWNAKSNAEKALTAKFEELMEALDLTNVTEDSEGWGWYDNMHNKGCSEAGYGMYLHDESGLTVCVQEDGIRWIGMEISEFLNQDYRVSECKQDVIDAAKKLGVDLDLKHVQFEVDEAGWS